MFLTHSSPLTDWKTVTNQNDNGKACPLQTRAVTPFGYMHARKLALLRLLDNQPNCKLSGHRETGFAMPSPFF